MTRAKAAELAGVKPRTIDQWVARGLINRYPGGYCTHELFARVDGRQHGKAVGGFIAAWARGADRDAPERNK